MRIDKLLFRPSKIPTKYLLKRYGFFPGEKVRRRPFTCLRVRVLRYFNHLLIVVSKSMPGNSEYKVRQLKPGDPGGSRDSQAPLFFEGYEEIDDAPAVLSLLNIRPKERLHEVPCRLNRKD